MPRLSCDVSERSGSGLVCELDELREEAGQEAWVLMTVELSRAGRVTGVGRG